MPGQRPAGRPASPQTATDAKSWEIMRRDAARTSSWFRISFADARGKLGQSTRLTQPP